MTDNPRPLLQVEDLHVAIEGKEILKGIDLTLREGECHALMGRNGSGKSTLSHAIMGHPAYVITRGRILYRGEDLTPLSTEERARAGIFLCFQYPMAIPGVTVASFLRHALKAVEGERFDPKTFRKRVKQAMERLGIDSDFIRRHVNDGFSGGEKKRLEMLQLELLAPRLSILDETDSGLDIDALRIVSDGINRHLGPGNAALVITHYQRILGYVKPDVVHVMIDGRIVRSGGPELALQLEDQGYDWLEPTSLEEASS
ncbi:MAG: Fe-S cluster assembly ATPase SufC [Acidobacteriota bacterium]|nr:Fe-S cluster assembly ATPase SufC [Acidobacteriota bacterium]MDQ7086739.1 Fe-S cluster assembly ATPase SufC [Acidobacteriota bacterium]